MKLTKEQLKQIIKEELNEVSSEKQRRWACAQTGDDFEGERSLSKKEAEEMCKGPMKRESIEAPREPVMEEADLDVGDVMSSLNKTMKELVGGMRQLDLSIDYLSSIFIDADPFEVGVQQKAFGRLATPSPAKKEAK